MVTPELLAHAIEGRGISIVAQPKLDLSTRQVVGAEILARWTHPELGIVPPDVFIGLAEGHGRTALVACADQRKIVGGHSHSRAPFFHS